MDQQQEQQQQQIKKTTNNTKTKKNKTQLSHLAKARIWEILDSESSAAATSAAATSAAATSAAATSAAATSAAATSAAAEPVEVDLETCIKCASPMMIMDDGFPTCTSASCGAMCKDVLDFSPEWRFYGADDKNAADPTRCGNPVNPLLQESSLGCKVLYTNKSSYEMRKIGKWTEWQSVPHREKSLYNEFMYISTMAQNAGIPKIFVDDALSIHKDISEQKMFRGCNRDGIKAASIYISCRLNGCTRTPHEIAEIFNLDKASATHGCSLALEILNNVYRNQGQEVSSMGITLPSAFIERYCSKLNINKDFTNLCRFIANKIEKTNAIPDNTPHSIAAGIIYFVCNTFALTPAKADIAAVCKVSEVTISKCSKKLESMKQDLIPPSVMQRFMK